MYNTLSLLSMDDLWPAIVYWCSMNSAKKFPQTCKHINSIISRKDMIRCAVRNALLKDNGNGLLTSSCKRGHLDVVRFLVSSGANIHVDGVLKLASQNGHLDVVKFLVSSGLFPVSAMNIRFCTIIPIMMLIVISFFTRL